MNPSNPLMNAAFRAYADLQLMRHQRLLEERQGDTEFDALEDRMTVYWEKLDADQRESVNGMGSDLNWIRRNGEPPPMGRSTDEVALAERNRLLAARNRNEWHEVLHLLRLCAPTIPIAQLAYLRGTAYDGIGLPAYANLFFQMAAELEPSLV